ncbi:MAG: ATP-dependent DNA helicase [Gammaproteobacteria bacterium]|nr:ATP-dependent DNA helicase [Gammaproteobacteria bacterium]
MDGYKSVKVLEQDGLLSQAIKGFTPRDAQQQMADAIEKTIAQNGQLIVEAGTGTGKTFGYLVPIFLSQKKTIISTGTKNLQDQLFFNDIPVIKKILSSALNVVLLKGRANYLCIQRLKRNQEDGRFVSRQLVSELVTISEWSSTTQTGDIAELDSIPEDSSIWPYATSTVDNCLNQDCAFYKDCFVVKARQQALTADIVVVNHHLFFADMALQEEGFGELLPGADVVVFDEAHHLPEIAAHFFSTALTSRQLLELARDSEAEALESAGDMKQIVEESAHLHRMALAMRTALGSDLRSLPWPDRLTPQLDAAILDIKDALKSFEVVLKEAGIRSKGLESCWKRSGELIERFDMVTKTAPENTVHWFETHTQSFAIHLTPIIVAEYFKKFMQDRKRSWIFTSATLTVKNNFKLFVDTMGLEKAQVLQLKSPFDYQQQALLYAPRGMPDPHAENYTEAVIEAAIPILEATQGKAFLLFTSHRALERAAAYLENRLPFPLLRQGTKPKRQLVDEFKALGNAILLGTSSFWYGVDVRGDALSCVIIDKLPFSSPDDPILQAKIKLLRKQGEDPFMNYQLPNAVLILKQGAGRLIRDVADSGVLMICDPRLVGNRYGEVFIQSLPNMSRTRDIDKVKAFLADKKLATEEVTA